MSPRYFTAEQANEALTAVRPLTERLVEHRRAFVAAQARRGELAKRISGNGGGIHPGELARATEALEQEAAGMARCIQGINGLGGLVKDADVGLVDFPARRGDEEVLLCWRLGEDEVGFWHPGDEGFAGRRPLPL